MASSGSLFYTIFGIIFLAIGFAAIMSLGITTDSAGSAAARSQVRAVCGDGIVRVPEQCDGGTAKACIDANGMPGTQKCTNACRYGPCIAEPRCGNNVLDYGEECDRAQLGGQSCRQLGFSYGTLLCSPSCVLDTSECIRASCGNAVVDQREQCDDGNNVKGDGCDQYCMLEK